MYDSGFYPEIERGKISEAVRKNGFEPLLISDSPGTTYPLHRHPESKLLAFLSGTMEVIVDGKKYICTPGDRLIIPGNIEHSAVVGKEGCQFFWSEKLM